MRTFIILSLVLLSSCYLFGQGEDVNRDTSYEFDTIDLKEVVVIPPPKFESNNTQNDYYMLRDMVIRTYPYAKMASDKLTVAVEHLSHIKRKRQKRRYTKSLKKFTETDLKDTLKTYTIWEGQILIKLIHRQTGYTCYDLLKSFRNRFEAFVYNTSAHFFSMSLKRKFEPEKYYRDFLVEDILRRAFADGSLDEQKPAFTIEYDQLLKVWNRQGGANIISPFKLYTNKASEDEGR